jgi:hypothetical protein
MAMQSFAVCSLLAAATLIGKDECHLQIRSMLAMHPAAAGAIAREPIDAWAQMSLDKCWSPPCRSCTQAPMPGSCNSRRRLACRVPQ